MNNNFLKNVAVWLLIGFLVFLIVDFYNSNNTVNNIKPISYSNFLNDVKNGNVSSVQIRGNNITGRYNNGSNFSTYAPNDLGLIDKLEKNNIEIIAQPIEKNSPGLLDVLISWFPMLLLIGVWIFFMRQMQSGTGRAMGFGKSRAKLLNENKDKVTFKDVAGIDEAKAELEEIVEFLKDPSKFQRLGGKIPKGALLVGPPGTGKTLLARAIAGEANVPFFSISGSDFVEMFVGVGASRVRDMFEQGKKNAPCIIFIDEIDAVGRHRGAGLGGGNDEREQTLNQLLVEMDGFDATEGVILIAATNRPDVLDPALLRPGRFDRQVVVPNPDIEGRNKILNVHTRKLALAPDVDITVIARGTPGFSGADLANLSNEAALLAARRNKRLVTMQDFEDAKDKVLMGAERRSMVMTKKEKELTAYHEAGHALVGIFTPGNDPLHKVTIIPRGRALGVTMNLPERDKYSETKTEMKAKLAMMFGGRVAEEIILVRKILLLEHQMIFSKQPKKARSMVVEWGMSDILGPLRYSENEEDVFLGRSVTQRKSMSDETAKLIDNEIRGLIDKAENHARKLLKKHIKHLHNLAKALLEFETLSGDDVAQLIKKGKFKGKSNTKNTPNRKTSLPIDSNSKKNNNNKVGGLDPKPAMS